MTGVNDLTTEPSDCSFKNSTEYHVVNGRHPTVELGLLGAGRLFVPNNVSLNPSANLHVITGPNMAGEYSY